MLRGKGKTIVENVPGLCKVICLFSIAGKKSAMKIYGFKLVHN